MVFLSLGLQRSYVADDTEGHTKVLLRLDDVNIVYNAVKMMETSFASRQPGFEGDYFNQLVENKWQFTSSS